MKFEDLGLAEPILRAVTAEGYTIPTMVKVGNLFGTDGFLPFFQAQIVEAKYL